MNNNQHLITGNHQPAAGNYKAVLFDLDGTLLDSLEDLADSMNRVLAAMGFPAHPVSSYRYFVGDGVEMLVQRSLPPEKIEESRVQEGVAMMRQDYGRNWATKTGPYPGIVEMLDRLRELGCILAVLSNKPHAVTVEVVDHFFPDKPFAAVWGSRQEIARKPSPQGALALASELGILPQDFLYLGDTNTDMLTAKGAGMRAIGAAWGFRTVEELADSGADKIVAHPREVVDIYTSADSWKNK